MQQILMTLSMSWTQISTPEMGHSLEMIENRKDGEQTQNELDNEELKDATNTMDAITELETDKTSESDLRVATTTDTSIDKVLTSTDKVTELKDPTTNEQIEEVGTNLNTEDIEDPDDQGTSSECSNTEIMLSSANSKPYDIRKSSTRTVTHDLPQLEL